VRAGASAVPENEVVTAAPWTGLELSSIVVRLYPHRAFGGDPVGVIVWLRSCWLTMLAEIIDTRESRVTMAGVSRQTG
jgi:hypothetical protein